MCGIAGLMDTTGRREIDRALLARMNDSLHHRGPDEQGLHLAPGLGLAHRRLSIIDLSGGQQPLFNEDRSVVVVYNGEIYNFQELVPELQAAGHVFRTQCDTEVIVHAWEQWGERCLDRFNGQFAFALWDARRETLFLARDRLGEKPLYWTLLPDGTLAFASELKALLLHPGVRRDLDPAAVEDYFAYGYVPDPKSVYRGIAKLPPAHKLTVRRGRAVGEPQPYWSIRFAADDAIDADDAAEELRQRLQRSVRLRMIADVPLGAFLSGGVDSSAVVATMADVSSGPVNTCSISFGEKRFDESKYAAQVAQRYRTDHFVRQVDADDFDLLDRLAGIYDEPFADSSAMPTFRVCALARERVTVALSGDAGDELFAGYRRYKWHHNEELVRGLLPHWLRRPLFGAVAALYPKADWLPRPLRAKATLRELARNSAEAYFHSVSTLPDTMRRRLFSDGFRRALQGYDAVEVLAGHMNGAPVDDHLAAVQYADLKTYLPGDILVKVDRASMANSLEVRVPLLDHELVEWAATLPRRLKLRNGEGKWLLKRAMAEKLPHELMHRPKMGFAVPLATWFRGPLRQRLRAAVAGPVLAETGWFDMAYLARLADEHQSGRSDHSAALWSLLMFEAFLRQVHGVAAPAPERRPALAVNA